MIELFDTFPDVHVQAAEYNRLLGYPRGWELRGRAAELAEETRAWYSKNGRPWVYARSASLAIAQDHFIIDGVEFHSERLLSTLRRAEASSAVLVAVSAGPEVEEQAQRLWREEKPDEYFFLEVLGSAVVEHLTTMTGARLCAWADGKQLAVLPHYSPGYPKWDVSEQSRLLSLVPDARLTALESGALLPKKSLLAVFGLTPHVDRVRRLTELIPCDNCSFTACQFRRTVATPLSREAKYVVNQKALRRWADERLKLEPKPDGSVQATFTYEGTTCTNMGRTLTFDYQVELGPRDEGYPIREQHCGPAPGDAGHKSMCKYLTNAEQLMVSIAREKPLLGQRLNDVLEWRRPQAPAGCYCEPASREHKWGLVLETIHYALARREES